MCECEATGGFSLTLMVNHACNLRCTYYLPGDDSIDSQDSRFTGVIGGDQFRGRVWCILAPWKRAGFVQ